MSKFTFSTEDKDDVAEEHQFTEESLEEGAFMIPSEIATSGRWLAFKLEENNGKMTKVPYSTKITPASESKYGTPFIKKSGVRTKENWADSYMDAYNFVKETNKRNDVKSLDGVGFVLGDGFAGVDLDDVVNEDNQIKNFANEFIGSIPSFTEFSPSGTGLHILFKGEIDTDYKQKCSDLGAEFYDDDGRWFTVTGNYVKGTPTSINECTDEVQRVQRKWMDERTESAVDTVVDFETSEPSEDVPDDDVVVKTMCNFSDEFERLHNGSNHVDKNDGANESDLSYCNKLSWICQSRERQMRRIWLNSPRAREKLNRDDYVKKTIETALASNPSDFSGEYHR